MKKYAILLVVLLISLWAISQDKDPDILLKQLVSGNSVIGASAGYSIDGTTIWQSAVGSADKKTKKPFEQDTKVRMASIAKPMTAIAVMQLVEQELIDLDAPIQKYIPNFPKQPKTQITTRHLLSQTSGIDGYKDGKEAQTTTNYPTLTDAINIFKDRALLFEPGTQYSYTTYGYTVLGAIIERTSGMSYGTYMQKNIWNKADMMHTGIEVFRSETDNKSGLYHKHRNGKIKAGKENNLSNRIPGGGFYTTVGDMLKFGNSVINNTFIKAETLRTMRQHHSLEKERNGYGFGWFLYNPKPNEGAIIGHTGEQTGCSSQLFIIPEKGIVAIVLANTSGALREASILASKLMNIALSKE